MKKTIKKAQKGYTTPKSVTDSSAIADWEKLKKDAKLSKPKKPLKKPLWMEAADNPKMKKGGKVMLKRADGSYSQRGLWDNIRANKGSGKAPSKEMLKQERKIKAKKAQTGDSLSYRSKRPVGAMEYQPTMKTIDTTGYAAGKKKFSGTYRDIGRNNTPVGSAKKSTASRRDIKSVLKRKSK